MRVLIIEDNDQLATLVAAGIDALGFRSDIASTLADANLALSALHYDALILDLQLPDGNGVSWLGRHKSTIADTAVLVMTARCALDERIAALDAGADDYVVKPVDVSEIAARLRALAQRSGPRSPPVLVVGSLAYDVSARSLKHRAADVALTHKEAELVELLMRRAGQVVSKTEIIDAIHRLGEDVTLNSIEALVSRLRHKLGGSGGESPLNTVRGMGYILKDAAP